MSMKSVITAIILTQTIAMAAQAQQGTWAPPGDATAAKMIDLERQWAEAGCTGEQVEKELLADDFVGTAPNGTLYTKEDALKPGNPVVRESKCHLYGAKVRFYGDAIAVVYGTEGSVRHIKKGMVEKRCLAWTDTWLKRGDSWQIVAVQDMRVACPK